MKDSRFPYSSQKLADLKTVGISRRSLLRRCSVLAAMTGLPLWMIERDLHAATEPAKMPSPNERPGIALVGCGGMGRGDAVNAANFGEIIAVCDVDDTHAAAAAEQFTIDGKVPERYSDFPQGSGAR